MSERDWIDEAMAEADSLDRKLAGLQYRDGCVYKERDQRCFHCMSVIDLRDAITHFMDRLGNGEKRWWVREDEEFRGRAIYDGNWVVGLKPKSCSAETDPGASSKEPQG